ncbi:MAG TPA: NYN domain-containing protein [Syntrophorhabdaceae bacterium]|nr:NYN domain-containing protein [Syntrophorhabdaceae bacterium]
MAHIVIDGYNYINRINASSVQKGATMDLLRRDLLERCARYKKARGTRVTVVFDAYGSPSVGRHSESYRGVDVVYSGQGETADEVIIGWIRKRPAGLIVVSSDRAIIDEAKASGVAFLTTVKLAEMMAAPVTFGKEEDCEEDRGPKKGNPRKLPKKLRKAVKTIDKL